MGRGDELIAVVGLGFEARIAAGPGVRVVTRRNGEDLTVSLSRAFRDGARGVVSFGVAGGLSPGLQPGTCVIGSAIISDAGCIGIHDRWSQNLLQAMPGAVRGALYGSSGPVSNPRIKAALHKKTGAIAVDMESHIVGELAAVHGLPMAAIRVVTDPAQRALPPSVVRSLRPNGNVDFAALLWSLLRRPCDLPAIARLARDAQAARATLWRGRKLLVSSLGGSGLDDKPADGFAIAVAGCIASRS